MRKLVYIMAFSLLIGCGRSTTPYKGTSDGSTGLCSMIAAAGISARVTYGTGVNPSQIQLTAQDGGYSETLTGYADTTGAMNFAGAYERTGTYTVTATYPGRTPQTKTLTVTGGSCHVTGQTTSFAF